MLKVTKKGKHCKLALEGELTIYNAADLKTAMLEHLKSATEMEIDLSEVSEVDTAALQVLACTKRDAENNSIPFSLVHHSKSVIEALDLYNMTSYFGDPVLISNQQWKLIE